MVYESLVFASRPPAGQHMRQHDQNEIFKGQTAHSKGVFLRILNNFSGVFPELPGGLDEVL